MCVLGSEKSPGSIGKHSMKQVPSIARSGYLFNGVRQFDATLDICNKLC